MIRAFIALELPEETVTQIISLRDKVFKNISNINWEKREKLHITLKFLGDSEKNVLDSLSNQLKNLAENYNKIYLSFDKFGIFKSNNIPRILWIGAKENEQLTSLVQSIEDICSQYSYPKEQRVFKTHITLLRIKNNNNIDNIIESAKQKFSEIETIADKLTLFQSQLLKSGSIYIPLQSFIINKK